jgi:RNA polymerase sigma-70 factor, ECF subfamily
MAMDKKELEQIITVYQDGLYRYAFFRTGSAEDAKDIVQTVFVNVFHKSRKETITNMKAYLYKCVQNGCLNCRRDKKPQTANEPTALQTGADDTSHRLLLKEQYSVVQSILGRLPAQQAEVIRLRIIDELNFAEIAALRDEPETTIKSRFKYGIDKLKTIIKSKTYYHEMF